MPNSLARRASICLTAALALAAACARPSAPSASPRSTRYDDLVALFENWRAFQKPALHDGVPDYSVQAMAAQRRELAAYQRRLAAIDPSGWPVAQQVDLHLVR